MAKTLNDVAGAVGQLQVKEFGYNQQGPVAFHWTTAMRSVPGAQSCSLEHRDSLSARTHAITEGLSLKGMPKADQRESSARGV